MLIQKKCSKCREPKPITDFYKHSNTIDGLQYSCKVCVDAACKKYYADNKDTIIPKKLAYQAVNVEKHNQAAKKYNHSPLGRLCRFFHARLNTLLGKDRESFFHLIGLTPSALVVHLMDKLPEGTQLEGYGKTWVVGFVAAPTKDELICDPREFLNWKNLIPVVKINKKHRDLLTNETKENRHQRASTTAGKDCLRNEHSGVEMDRQAEGLN